MPLFMTEIVVRPEQCVVRLVLEETIKVDDAIGWQMFSFFYVFFQILFLAKLHIRITSYCWLQFSRKSIQQRQMFSFAG